MRIIIGRFLSSAAPPSCAITSPSLLAILQHCTAPAQPTHEPNPNRPKWLCAAAQMRVHARTRPTRVQRVRTRGVCVRARTRGARLDSGSRQRSVGETVTSIVHLGGGGWH